jgi:hypothetical protein
MVCAKEIPLKLRFKQIINITILGNFITIRCEIYIITM